MTNRMGCCLQAPLKAIAIVVIGLLLVSCASTRPPSNPHNLCSIFKEKRHWHQAAQQANARWGTPIHIMMAIMYQESSYRHDVQPPRPWFLFIPLPRRSSAYGYAQAQNATWEAYRKEAGSWLASRDNFADAIDFIGWYTHKSRKINGVSLWRADLLYLNYHEGWGGYRRGTYRKKAWLLKTANKVQARAQEYSEQLRRCRF